MSFYAWICGISLVLPMIGLWFTVMAHERPTSEPAITVMQIRVELAKVEVERVEIALKDAIEDYNQATSAVNCLPRKMIVQAQRKVEDCKHSLKVAKLKLTEAEALLEYTKMSGKLP